MFKRVRKGSLTMLLFNAQSVNHKWFEINNLISLHNAKLIIITKTWLNKNNDSLAYSYGSYQKFVSHRQNKRGGEVMCLLSCDYDANELSKPISLPDLCDCLIVKSRTLKSVFIIVYKSTSCSSVDTIKLLEAFDDMMSEYTRYGYTISILGDLNFRDSRWNVEPPEADSMLSIALLEFITAWDMTQIVTQPTRGRKVLDVIITTSPAI